MSGGKCEAGTVSIKTGSREKQLTNIMKGPKTTFRGSLTRENTETADFCNSLDLGQ